MHGSGLDNSVFMHSGSVLVQLLPYKVEHRCTFASSARSVGVTYMEWQLQDESKTFLHWDLLEQADAEKLKRMTKRQIINAGQVQATSRETLMFWINQVRKQTIEIVEINSGYICKYLSSFLFINFVVLGYHCPIG